MRKGTSAPKGPAKPSGKDSSGNLGFEAKPWLSADKRRNNMDAMDTLKKPTNRIRS